VAPVFSYRVRGVYGSCAEHLTVESYTVIICQQSYLLRPYYWCSITHSLFHSRLKTFLVCKSCLLQHFLFFFIIHYMDSPDCLLLLLSLSFPIMHITVSIIVHELNRTSEHIRLFTFYFFCFFTLFSCRFRAVD